MGEPNPEVKEEVVVEEEVVAAEPAEAKQQLTNKNGKKAEGGAGSSFFTWFMVLALLGVWTSVAVVWLDLVDYQSVVGKLGSYDADNDGDFDLEDVQVILDADIDGSIPETLSNLSEEASGWLTGFFTVVYDIMTPFEIEDEEEEDDVEEVVVASKDIADEKLKEVAGKQRPRASEGSPFRDPAGKLKQALKRQLAMIHERVEAKKIARLALAELRSAVVKEEEERMAQQAAETKLEEVTLKARQRKEAKLLKVVERMEELERKEEEEEAAKAKREEKRVEREKGKEAKEKKAKRQKAEEDKKPASKSARRHDKDDEVSKKAGKRSKDAAAKERSERGKK